MGFQSLHRGLLLLKYPVMWIYPLILMLAIGAMVYTTLSTGNTFLMKIIALFTLFGTPLFLAGSYGAIKENDFSIRSYISAGLKGYFRVTLPGVFIIFVAYLIVLFVMLPMMTLGMSVMMSAAVFIILIPYLLLVFFYNTAAIFEDKGMFACIKRSLEVSGVKGFEVLTFFVIAIIVMFVISMGLMILWSILLNDQLTPLLSMTQDEIMTMSQNPEAFMGLIGDAGIIVSAVVSGLGAFIVALFFIPYKGVFYRDVLKDAVLVHPSQPLGNVGAGSGGENVNDPNYHDVGQGEYDEKGRWYKYS